MLGQFGRTAGCAGFLCSARLAGWGSDGPGAPSPGYQRAGSLFINPDGTTARYPYNDIPLAFNANVDTGEIPYTPASLAGGNERTLTAAETDAAVGFLCTLTEGFDPNDPSAYDVPAQCAPQAR